VNYLLLRQQSNIFVMFAKVELFNPGQITNRLLLPFPVFQPPFRLDNKAIWCLSQNLKNVVADFLSHPAPLTTGSVAATTTTDPVDFEEMAAEQHHCPETQRLLGGTSLKLAFP
jgi:hypothetical protein